MRPTYTDTVNKAIIWRMSVKMNTSSQDKQTADERRKHMKIIYKNMCYCDLAYECHAIISQV